MSVREATLVEVTTRKVLVGKGQDVYACIAPPAGVRPGLVRGTDEMVLENVKTEVIPLHHFARARDGIREDWLLGYTRELQDLMVMPFDALQKENRWLQESNTKLRVALFAIMEMDWKQRLRFLFTRRLPE